VDGSPYSSRGGSVLATNGPVHEEMLRTIREFQQEWSRAARS
jgi:hypothetical protein